MVTIYSKKYNYIQIYIPKCACSVIRRAFIDIHKSEFTEEHSLFLQKNGIHKLGSLFPPLEPNLMYNKPKILMCRSPYTRALSAYYDKFLTINARRWDSSTPNHIKNGNDWKTCKLYNLHTLYQTTNSKQALIDCINLTQYHKESPSINQLFEILKIKESPLLQVDDSFLSYLNFINFCYTEGIHSHKHLVFDEHHYHQTHTLLRYNLDTIFSSNIKIAKLEDGFEQFYNYLFEILPENKAIEAKKIYETILQDKKFQNSSISKNAYVDNIFYDKENSKFLYSVRDQTKMLPHNNNMLSKKCIELINSIYNNDFKYLKYDKITT